MADECLDVDAHGVRPDVDRDGRSYLRMLSLWDLARGVVVTHAIPTPADGLAHPATSFRLLNHLPRVCWQKKRWHDQDRFATALHLTSTALLPLYLATLQATFFAHRSSIVKAYKHALHACSSQLFSKLILQSPLTLHRTSVTPHTFRNDVVRPPLCVSALRLGSSQLAR